MTILGIYQERENYSTSFPIFLFCIFLHFFGFIFILYIVLLNIYFTLFLLNIYLTFFCFIFTLIIIEIINKLGVAP